MKYYSLLLSCGLAFALCLSGTKANASEFSYSGTLREKVTHVSSVDFDKGSPEAGSFWTQRFTLDGQLTLNDQFSFHGRLLSALQKGNEASPVEQNNLDLQIAYISYSAHGGSNLRIGRQELRFGSQRLIGTRDGTNVRRVWDGIRHTYRHHENHSIDFFTGQLVNVESQGVFNDSSNDARQLYGIYSTSRYSEYSLDIYAIHHEVVDKSTIEGNANQQRTSIGIRNFSNLNQFYWDWEVIYQFGEHGSSDIRAWTLATNTGYRFNSDFNYDFMLSINVASGDDRRDDGRLSTFDALYPRGSYFSEAAILGPANFYNLNPYFRFTPAESLSVSIDVNVFWRLEKEDGVYGPPGNLIRAPLGSDERLVNIALSAGVEWTISDSMTTSLLYTHSMPQAFLKETGNSDKTNFIEFSVNWQF